MILKLKFRVLVFIAFINLASYAQEVSVAHTKEPKYKTTNPDSLKLPINRSELIKLAQALNVTSEDSVKCDPLKIWYALTNPLTYKSTYKTARIWAAMDDEDPFLDAWSNSNEKRYTEVILFTYFFNPFLYMINVGNFDKVDPFLPDQLSRISASQKLSSHLINYSTITDQKISTRLALTKYEALLKKIGVSLLVMEPIKNSADLRLGQFYVIPVQEKFKPDAKRIFNKLGFKISEFRTIKK